MSNPKKRTRPGTLALAMLLTFAAVEGLSWLTRDGGYAIRELVFYARYLEIVVWIAIWGFRSRKVWVQNTTLSFISFTGLYFVIDFVFFILVLIKMPAHVADTVPLGRVMSIQEPELGYKPITDSTIHVIKKIDTFKIYDISFTTDQYGRRINPYDTVKRHNRYALFFGCSITFGEGINDSATIPARFAQDLPAYHAYNFGYSGYGTQNMLVNLQKPKLRNQIAEPDGIGFYIFINDHINRAIGDMRITDSWGATLPYYYQKGDTLIRDGNFLQNRWFISHLYGWLSRSSIITYFDINFPLHLRDRHYKLATMMIKESYNQYVKKFGNDRFYVVIFPGESLEIILYLQAAHIKYLDYSKLFSRWAPQYCYMPYDPHPRPAADVIFAKKLAEDAKRLMP